jgi:uncharacterized protein (TIGR02099 family)
VDKRELRAGVYYRLHWLWPWLVKPGIRRGLRMLGWTLFVAWLLFVALILALRYVVLPKVGDYQTEIEQAASSAVGQPVKIGKITARWSGLNPDLVLEDVTIADKQGLPAFTLRQVESVLSWQSVLRMRPMLSLLAFDGPVLHVRRESNGRITVAGLEAEGESDPAFAEWVLDQPRIRILDATIVWDDRLRKAPPLILEDLQFGLDNRGSRHRFGLSAAPPSELAARIDIRGEINGDLGQVLEHLAGQIFVEVDYADLAAWRKWVDYPIHLPQGRGALRVWGDLADGAGKLTADVALEELRVRLGRNLPELDLSSMRGRLEASYKGDQRVVVGRKVELLTMDGIRVAPTDFNATWQQDANGRLTGSAGASFLDLAVIGRLAAFLPLDARSRQLLGQHQPQGRISELRTSWEMADEKLARYALKATFSNLGMRAGGYFPGANGLAGLIDLNEKAGELSLDAGQSGLALPAIFPEPNIDFDQLKARVTWKAEAAGLAIKLERLQFDGADATGTASGSYFYDGNGPGVIDLGANIARADARAVWRYLPHAVNAEARDWVRHGVVAGKGHDGKLVLKGNLADFPFRDPVKGKFLVTAKATEGKVDYVPGWPVIENIEADLSFGVGMKITSDKGRILGAKLSDVLVEIPDFESHEEQLLVRGVANGPTSEFLRYIEQSPVSKMIDRFTEGMKAQGNGKLDLTLDIPLRHAFDTKLRGVYQLQNNQLDIVSALPTIAGVGGRLVITEKSIVASDLSGQVFGGPLKVAIKSEGGRIGIQAAGTAKATDLNQHFRWPLMEHLAGSAPWAANISIRGRNADFVIESPLTGISATLPEPLNKAAEASWPLRIERTAPDPTREQYMVTVGNKIAQALVLRRQDGNEMRAERAVIALGDGELRLPEKGLAVMVAAPRFDADPWKDLFSGDGGGSVAQNGFALSQVAIRTPKLHLLGRDFSQADLTLRPREGGWQIGLNMREVAGDLLWRGAGEGSLEGRLRRLVLRPAAEMAAGASNPLINSLPSMNLAVDDFYLGEKHLGQLDLKARNEKGAWQLDVLNLKNQDGSLRSRGVWRNTGRQQMRLDFDLSASDVGKLLERLGYGDGVRRGSGGLSGMVEWDGPPTAIHYPSMSGRLQVSAEKGQFNKLEPGVGKLLGLISLQSLSRRLTLDFRDIFSDGLAFDSIEGKLVVRKGIMRTSGPLRIKAPAAQIEMEGDVDLKNETQDMRVVVRPELGTVAAVGVALINPVAGAATLLAGSVLQNPLNRLFSYNYHVTGTWSEPLVDKAGKTEVILPGFDINTPNDAKEEPKE